MPDARACPRCKGSNRPEARFCDGCGTALALRLYRAMGADGHSARLAG